MKKWYQSKTVWFNIVTTVVAFLAFPEFISVISPSFMPWIALISAAGNYVLRVYYTTSPIE